jgi:hypothetical protein
MQQNSGFENRFIDTYCYPNAPALEDTAGVLHFLPYAQIFKPNDSSQLAVFSGIKTVSSSSEPPQKDLLQSASIILPVALLLVTLLFIFLKNTLKSSVGDLFLIGLFPKALQEAERRQIERNTLIIDLINVVSFFTIAFILYAFVLRFVAPFVFFEPPNIPENLLYLSLFFFILIMVFLFFYARNAFLTFFGNVFSAPRTMKRYRKPYKLLFVSLSPVLLFVALLTAFAPFSLMNLTSFYILMGLLACYAIFVVVSLLKFLNFTSRYTVHIFLYLCTLEILPLLVAVKLMQSVCF